MELTPSTGTEAVGRNSTPRVKSLNESQKGQCVGLSCVWRERNHSVQNPKRRDYSRTEVRKLSREEGAVSFNSA